MLHRAVSSTELTCGPCWVLLGVKLGTRPNTSVKEWAWALHGCSVRRVSRGKHMLGCQQSIDWVSKLDAEGSRCERRRGGCLQLGIPECLSQCTLPETCSRRMLPGSTLGGGFQLVQDAQQAGGCSWLQGQERWQTPPDLLKEV